MKWVHPWQRDTSLGQQPSMKIFNGLLLLRPAIYDIFPKDYHLCTLVNNLTSSSPKPRTSLINMDCPYCSHQIQNQLKKEVILNSLYLLLRLLFGEITVVEEGIIEEDPSVKQTVCSIFQEIVYAVSSKRKLTPKHIGLDLARHHATCSKALLDLFHVADHTIGIDTVAKIDTLTAQDILDKVL